MRFLFILSKHHAVINNLVKNAIRRQSIKREKTFGNRNKANWAIKITALGSFVVLIYYSAGRGVCIELYLIIFIYQYHVRVFLCANVRTCVCVCVCGVGGCQPSCVCSLYSFKSF